MFVSKIQAVFNDANALGQELNSVLAEYTSTSSSSTASSDTVEQVFKNDLQFVDGDSLKPADAGANTGLSVVRLPFILEINMDDALAHTEEYQQEVMAVYDVNTTTTSTTTPLAASNNMWRCYV